MLGVITRSLGLSGGDRDGLYVAPNTRPEGHGSSLYYLSSVSHICLRCRAFLRGNVIIEGQLASSFPVGTYFLPHQ